MADSSKTSEPSIDLDLEDGEIESDNEESEVIIIDDISMASHANVMNTLKNRKNDVASLSSILLHKIKDGGVHLDAKEKGIDGRSMFLRNIMLSRLL